MDEYEIINRYEISTTWGITQPAHRAPQQTVQRVVPKGNKSLQDGIFWGNSRATADRRCPALSGGERDTRDGEPRAAITFGPEISLMDFRVPNFGRAKKDSSPGALGGGGVRASGDLKRLLA